MVQPTQSEPPRDPPQPRLGILVLHEATHAARTRSATWPATVVTDMALRRAASALDRLLALGADVPFRRPRAAHL